MPSSPLDGKHGRMMSGVACHHRLWAAHTVGRRGVWHDITTLGKQTRSATSGVACYHRLWTAHTIGNVERGMTSPSLDSTHGRQRKAWHDEITALGQHTRSATSGVACYHLPWTAHMVEQRRAWHAIIAFGQHRQSNGVGHGMLSSPLDGKHGRTTSSVACHHCHWVAQTVGRRRALHAIIAFGQHTQSNDVERGMTSPPLDNTRSATSCVA